MFKSELAKTLMKKLQSDERTTESPIEVSDDNGVITLSGTAHSNEARQAAGEIAAAEPGVISVINDLTVVEPDVTRGIPAGANPNVIGMGPANPAI